MIIVFGVGVGCGEWLDLVWLFIRKLFLVFGYYSNRFIFKFPVVFLQIINSHRLVLNPDL